MRSLMAFDSVVCVDPALLLRAIEVYETDRIDFAEAYLVACAESTGVGKVASFDRSIDRVPRSSGSNLPSSEARTLHRFGVSAGPRFARDRFGATARGRP